ncbi:MAG: precorrin-4 C(11)-methyltransferase [Actinobacteria bacterium]|nr:precorrin-4 C(11)-methyltransferase [Actinomycetota bacterium]
MTKEKVAVYFIGAGPGALDLMTVRAQRIIQSADLILYADSLVNEEVGTLAKPGAEVVGSSGLTLDEIVSRMVEAARVGRVVARVHSGDPSIYGAIREQMVALAAAGIRYAVVPGVSSLFGAAAELGVELTVPEVSQTIIITRAEGRTPVPDTQRLRDLASHRATLAIYLSAGMIERVVAELRDGGYPEETPVAVVYRATWPDQRILRGTISDIAATVRAAGITRQALILVGEALRPIEEGEPTAASLLYDPSFGHGYRERA